jgi:hypothetical protein
VVSVTQKRDHSSLTPNGQFRFLATRADPGKMLDFSALFQSSLFNNNNNNNNQRFTPHPRECTNKPPITQNKTNNTNLIYFHHGIIKLHHGHQQ